MPHATLAGRPAHRRAVGGLVAFLIVIALALLGLAADSMLTAMLATAAEAPARRTLAGDRVAVYTLAGAVTVEAGGGRDLEVEIATGGRDAARLDVETGRIGDRNTLRVLFPSNRIVYPEIGRGSRTTIRVRDDGTFGGGGTRLFGRTVQVRGSGGGLEAHADLRVRVPAGKSVDVYVGAGRIAASRVDGDLRLDTASGPVRATGTRGALTVDTGSGSVTVEDAEGEVSVDTGSGSVDVSGVRGPSLVVDTGSGGVRGVDLAVESLEVDTGSGGVELAGVSADRLLVDTGSGGVRISLDRSPRDVSVDTGSGGVTLRVPSDYGARVTIETGSGDIDSDLPMKVERRRWGTLTGEIGDGRGRLTVDTGSGDVRILAASSSPRR